MGLGETGTRPRELEFAIRVGPVSHHAAAMWSVVHCVRSRFGRPVHTVAQSRTATSTDTYT